MAQNKLENYVSDEMFTQKMSIAFSDLRADYELTMDVDQSKISELQATHVDVKNQLKDLSSLALASSGVVSGLRGTGKTHLLLLARDSINTNCFDNASHGVLCVYLNLKRLNLPNGWSQEICNRIFSVFIYNEISKQLTAILNKCIKLKWWEKILINFESVKKNNISNLKAAIEKLIEYNEIARVGNAEFTKLTQGTMKEEIENSDLLELIDSFNSKISSTDIDIGFSLSMKYIEEVSKKLTAENTYLNYLNIETVRDEIISLLRLLNLKGIVFFVDEWEKISYIPDLQKCISFFIDRILDNPIYCWIAKVPYRGELHHLESGSDLQHLIDLDDRLIYENSAKDRDLCLNYFRQLIDKRLLYYFNDATINTDLLFNNKRNFEKLVLASMGNSRDFGTMLYKCWSEFQTYRTTPLSPGRPYQYISESMVINSIKNNGAKKMSNIENDITTSTIWSSIEEFCSQRKSSHFAIEDNRDNRECLLRTEFSNLVYHRLIHLRKKSVPAKDTSITNKLSIYALDFSSTYDMHANNRQMQFITDYNAIHDRVRRYIYSPVQIVNTIQIKSGEIFPCSSCNENILITKMAAAWQTNACPFCGNRIRPE